MTDLAEVRCFRRRLTLAALFYACLLAYGSWLPFHFRPHVPGELEQDIVKVLQQPVQWSTSSDFLFNALLGVPLGFLASALCCTFSGATFRLFLSTTLCFVVAGIIEGGQFWIQQRIPSKSDVIAQMAGASVGCMIEIILGGWLITQLTTISKRRGSPDAYRRLAILFTLAYLIVALIPVGGLEQAESFRRRAIELAQYGSSPIINHRQWIADWRLFVKIIVYVPLGYIISEKLTSHSSWSVSVYAAILSGTLATVVELLQLLLRSSRSDWLELVGGAVGGAVGAMAYRTMRVMHINHYHRVLSHWAGWGALTYFSFLCIVFWYPLDTSFDAITVRSRSKELFSFPFVSLWIGSNVTAVTQILWKTTAFAVLGSLLTLRQYGPPVTIGDLPATALLTFLAGFVIEIGQIWSADHYPDTSDAILAMAGGIVGRQLILLLAPPLANAPLSTYIADRN